MARLDPRLAAMLRRMAPAARARAVAFLQQKFAPRRPPLGKPIGRRNPLTDVLSSQRPDLSAAVAAWARTAAGRAATAVGPLVTKNAGDAVAAGISQVLDREARSVLGEVPGGTAVLNAVEGIVGDVFSPGFSGGVTAAEAAYISAGATPVEKAARVASIEGRTGEKQLVDPSSPSGYRTIGGGSIRGVPRGFEAEALED